jgi:hypothetical protein
MPAQWKKAEYKAGTPGDVYTPRAEWYKLSEGMTIGNRVVMDGEIFHISELDTPGPDGHNIESFRPLNAHEQMRRFGRVMYQPYEPTDEELRALGWEREDVRADEAEAAAQLEETLDEDYEDYVHGLNRIEMQREAAERWGLNFPDNMPANRMRQILLKNWRESPEGEVNAVTPQMKSNLAQRTGKNVEVGEHGDVAVKAGMGTPAKKTSRKKTKAAKAAEEEETTTEDEEETTDGVDNVDDEENEDTDDEQVTDEDEEDEE